MQVIGQAVQDTNESDCAVLDINESDWSVLDTNESDLCKRFWI